MKITGPALVELMKTLRQHKGSALDPWEVFRYIKNHGDTVSFPEILVINDDLEKVDTEMSRLLKFTTRLAQKAEQMKVQSVRSKPRPPRLPDPVSDLNSGGSFKTLCYEYDSFSTQHDLGVQFEAPYTETNTIKLIKKSVRPINPKTQIAMDLALKYTVFIQQEGKNLVMLGWNHGLLALKGKDGAFYAIGVCAFGDSDDNYDANVYTASENGTLTTLKGKVKTLGAYGPYKKDTPWRCYDLNKSPIRLDRLITFGITSCSFACVFPRDERFVVISHVAFAPPIPLFWMLQLYAGQLDVPKELNLLASLNVTNDELKKYTPDSLPGCKGYSVTARYLLRGPIKCSHLGNNAPYRTHPYVCINFTQSRPLSLYGAIGFNNDPTMPVELPPLHSCMGEAASFFRSLKDAKAILESFALLLRGQLGFVELHTLTLNLLHSADLADQQNWFPYKSVAVNMLMKQIKTKNIKVPKEVEGKERAVFLLAEVVASSAKDAQFKLAFNPVLQAWTLLQMGFEFPLSRFHG